MPTKPTNKSPANAPSKNGWRRVKFGEMAECIGDRVDNPSEAGVERYVGLEHLDPESLKIRRWGTPDQVEATKLRFQPGDIIFGKRRAYQRKLAVADFEGICSAHAMVLRAREETVVKDFLPVFMQSEVFFERALAISVGSLSPTINWKTLATQEFAIPPKEEQRRIAEILWAADEVEQAMLNVVSKVNRVRTSLFGLSLNQWETKLLKDVAEFLDGKRVPLSQKVRARRQGVFSYYGASGVIDHVDDFLFDEPLVLLSEDGFNLVNRNSPVAFKVEGKVWVNNHAHVLRPRPGVNIDYLSEYLESISYEPYITGTFQRKLNKSECEQIPIPLPPPERQQQIADTLAEIYISTKAVEEHRNRTKQLQSSLWCSFQNEQNHV